VLSLFVLPQAACADMNDEITHLLSYIETSGCTFIRNGSRHQSQEAVKHIEKKYDYLKKHIETTEDFIDGAATKSSFSGKPYLIVCGGREMKTADWLHAELERYRSRQLPNR
jgi:hypothetical protein